MSLATVYSRALMGMDAPLVEVEAHLGNGLPAFNLVGLPDTEVKESRERVRAAIIQSGFDFPAKKITVNLAPADLPKDSGRFDLPIAIAILLASGQLQAVGDILSFEFAGELALSGRLRPIRGALAMTVACQQTQRSFVLPRDSAEQAALLSDVTVYVADSLIDVAACVRGEKTWEVAQVLSVEQTPRHLPDLLEVRGQHSARFALEVAAAGGHHLLMLGPPGTGKSMLAQRLPSILPALTTSERLGVARIRSLSQASALEMLPYWRPFIAPHHSASLVSLVGGGSNPKPGAISLAHHGILFLDELPEFDRKALEALREPLEQGHIHIARAKHHVMFPAAFQLVAAMNPCPCGFSGHPNKPCRCSIETIQRYRQKISGPLLDRIDIVIEVPALQQQDWANDTVAESSATVAQRVQDAYILQQARQGKLNAALSVSQLQSLAKIEPEAYAYLSKLINDLGFSARVFHRLLRLARTCADLQKSDTVKVKQVIQAIQLRRAGANHFS